MKNNDLPDGYMRMRDILKLFPVSESTWLLGVKAGRYPQKLRLTKKTVVWRRKDIEDLLRRVPSDEYQQSLEA